MGKVVRFRFDDLPGWCSLTFYGIILLNVAVNAAYLLAGSADLDETRPRLSLDGL